MNDTTESYFILFLFLFLGAKLFHLILGLHWNLVISAFHPSSCLLFDFILKTHEPLVLVYNSFVLQLQMVEGHTNLSDSCNSRRIMGNTYKAAGVAAVGDVMND